MKTIKLFLGLLVAGLAMLACNYSPSVATATSAPTFAAPAQPMATSGPTMVAATAALEATGGPTAEPQATGVSTAGPQATGAASALDPCQVVPQDEASALLGNTVEAGREAPLPDGSQGCLYAPPSGNLLTVEVLQAPDAATAEANLDPFIASLSAMEENLIGKSTKPTQIPDFADGALEVVMNFSSAGGLNGSAFAFVKGTTMVGIMDIGQDTSVPGLDALKAEATKALARLP